MCFGALLGIAIHSLEDSFKKMAERVCITLRPEEIQFADNCMKISDSRHGKYMISYQKIVSAVLRVPDREAGTYYEPELADITRDMKGDIILYDTGNCKWRILTDIAENKAGGVIIDLERV